MIFKTPVLLAAALAAVSVSAAPSFHERDDTSSGYALFNAAQASAMLSKAQSVYASHATTPAPSTGYVPNNQTGTVSSADLIKYGRYAGASYKVLDNSWTCMINCWAPETWGTVVDYHWDVSGTTPSFGFVAHKDNTKEILVVWRGSTVLMDWIQDFNFAPVPWPQQIAGSKVHTGFLQTYKIAADKIKSVVAGLAQKYPDYKIKLVGHSLGGAQATVATAEFALEHPEW
ncbi:hypothetical protein GGI12_005451, partial [Dipsacomyces acuminosporus]